MNAQQRIERLLEEVLRMPGNDKCADCRASAPRWASVNLGIFLCVNCASLHRKMGTHRSRVKSVTLDEWTRDQVVAMREMGNIRSNAIYNPDEAKHPPPPMTSADERDSELAKYIRRKYELGAFKRTAAKELATSNAITSRALAQDARTSHQASPHETLPPLQPSELPRRERDLPALPATAGRRTRPANNAPLWSGLAPQGTGASSTSNASATSTGSGSLSGRPVFPPRTSSSPAFSASGAATSTAAALLKPQAQAQAQAQSQPQTQPQPRPDLLIDIDGSSSSTRPLQLNNFPTVPAFPAHAHVHQPPTPLGGSAPVVSPGGLVSPLALGQQAFLAGPGTNPFRMSHAQLSPAAPAALASSPSGYFGQMHQPQPPQAQQQAQFATSPGGMYANGIGGGFAAGMNGYGGSNSTAAGAGASSNGMLMPMGTHGGMGGMGAGMNPMSMAMGVGVPGTFSGMHLQMPVQVQMGMGRGAYPASNPWGGAPKY